MTRYQVVSRPEVDDELADIWLNSSADKEAIRRAVTLVERSLAANPTQAGSHVAEGLWGIDVPPLRVFYTVDESRRIVYLAQFKKLQS